MKRHSTQPLDHQLPDVRHFAEIGLCACGWTQDAPKPKRHCRPFLHAFHRISPPLQDPLRGYDYCATDGKTLRVWCAEGFSPEAHQTRTDGQFVDQVTRLPFCQGYEITLSRDDVLAALPPKQDTRRNTRMVLRVTWAGDLTMVLTNLDHAPTELVEPRPGTVVHVVASHYLWDILVGMDRLVRVWLPEEDTAPLTFEGPGALAMLMPIIPL
jgi:hypothetical protein